MQRDLVPAFVLLLSFLTASQSLAAPTTVTLEGFVTESSDAAYAPGDCTSAKHFGQTGRSAKRRFLSFA